MQFTITYGREKVNFQVPDRCLPREMPIITPRKIKITDKMLDIEGGIGRALKNPVASPRLKDIVKGGRVALIVSDEFRSGQQEMIIKCLMEEIAAGSPKEVWTFCATGTHDPEIYAERIREWADRYAKKCGLKHKFFGHDCLKDRHIEIGKTFDGNKIEVLEALLKCDVRVYGHEAKHHYMCGYSCIDKQMLPGLSSAKTIKLNHKNALDDTHSFGGRNVWVQDPERRNNPFSKGAAEARAIADKLYLTAGGRLIQKDMPVFGLDMISDTKHIYWIASGDTSVISKEMTMEADRMSLFEVKPVKYVVISPGGPPASETVYSTQNCFDMALSGAIEDGGEALVVAPCEGRPDVPQDARGLAPDLKSKRLFYDNLAGLKDLPISEAAKWIDGHFELFLWKTDRVLKLMNRRKVKLYLYSTLPDKMAAAIGLAPVKDIQKWIDERTSRKGSKFRVIDQGNKILVLGRVVN